MEFEIIFVEYVVKTLKIYNKITITFVYQIKLK